MHGDLCKHLGIDSSTDYQCEIIIENVRFQHFCEKMWALKMWCVTKVGHCKCITAEVDFIVKNSE